MFSVYLKIFYLIVQLSHFTSVKCFKETTTIRKYPTYWQQSTDYSLKYLGSKFTIQQKGSDLLALSSLLLSMGYDDMYPPQLNAYLISINGTFDKGKNIITYFPGNIINWEGLQMFGLKYKGQYSHPTEFLQLRYFQSDIDEFGVIVQFNDKYFDGQNYSPQSQYAFVYKVENYSQSLFINNHNSPQRHQISYRDIETLIVFDKIEPHQLNSSCTDQHLVLNSQGFECYDQTDLSQVRDCEVYAITGQSQMACSVCQSGTYLDCGLCIDCPFRCSICRLNQQRQVQCLRCQFGLMNSPYGCISTQEMCRQFKHTQNGTQCLKCYDGSTLLANKTCWGCSNNCFSCESYQVCHECYPPFSLVNNFCELPQSVNISSNCQIVDNSGFCSVCLQKYINIDGLCIDCQQQYKDKEFCHNSYKLRCKKWTYNKCYQCLPEYRMTLFFSCIIDPQAKCFRSFDTVAGCNYCQKGYYVNQTRQCIPCQNGYTIFQYPYYCFECPKPENDPKNQCNVFGLNGQCLCSSLVLHFILQIGASTHNSFFENSQYRQSKLKQALATYLNIQWTSINPLSFQYIRSGQQAYYVFVGYVRLTVGNFDRLKLKQSIFDFDDFPIISVYGRVGELQKQFMEYKPSELTVNVEEQEGISDSMIALFTFGGMAAYILAIFLWNWAKSLCKNNQHKKPKVHVQKHEQAKNKEGDKTKRKFELDMISVIDQIE